VVLPVQRCTEDATLKILVAPSNGLDRAQAPCVASIVVRSVLVVTDPDAGTLVIGGTERSNRGSLRFQSEGALTGENTFSLTTTLSLNCGQHTTVGRAHPDPRDALVRYLSFLFIGKLT
jgi:hypothetical protein